MDISTSLPIFEWLSYLAAIVGIPLAIWLFYNEKRKERLDRELGTYDALDNKYIEFLNLCLENPELDVFDIETKLRKELTPEQKKKELMIFNILISILERAFLMYREHRSTKIGKTQWVGWDQYIHDWVSRSNFRKAWHILGEQFDTEFIEYMNAVVSGTKHEMKTV